MTLARAVLAAIVGIGGGLGGCADDGGPRLSRVTPASARAGANVELAGERFCGVDDTCTNLVATVELGLDPPMVQAGVIAYAARSATIQIPQVAPVGPTALVLTVAGHSSNALDFEVLP